MQANAATRQEIGRWLAGLWLQEMDLATLDLYRGDAGKSFLHTLDDIPALSGLVTALREEAARDARPETVRLDLAAAYGQLFLTGGPRSVPLYASAYLSDRGLLMQETARQTSAVLEQLGLCVPPGFNEPADHIGIQLGILAELAVTTVPDVQDEQTFLRDHLLPWVPTLAALCTRLSPVPLYRELGTATLGWLRFVEVRSTREQPGV